MSLSIKEKIIVCKEYDSKLNRLHTLMELTEPPFYPNLINYDNYHVEGEKILHEEHAAEVATSVKSIIKKADTEEILQFISEPNFDYNLTVRTRTMDSFVTSIEDSILYRKVYERMLTSRTKSRWQKQDHISVVRCFLVQLSKDIYFLREKTYILNANIYEFLEELCLEKNPKLTKYQLEKAIWQEAVTRVGIGIDITTASNFLTLDAVNKHLKAKYHDLNEIYWVDKGIMEFDNRQVYPDTLEQTTLEESYKKALKKV